MSTTQLPAGRRRAGMFTAAIAVLAIGGGAAALVTSDTLHAQPAINPPTAATPGGGLPASFADVAERVGPAVVNIQVSKKVGSGGAGQLTPDQLPDGMREFFERFFGDENPMRRFGQREDRGERGERGDRPRRSPREREMVGVGSGFIVSPDGFVVTNNHVVEGADEVTVGMQNRKEYQATVVGTDPKTDLALVKIKANERFPYVAFGDSEKVRVGDWIIAVGNPFGLGHTVTTGVISARGRTIGAGPYDDFLQVSAPINRGNSGGPTFNRQGEVIGVNTAIFSPSGGSVGIGFAIPSNMAQKVISQLEKKGKVERGWLGVVIQDVSEDMAASLNLPKDEGAIIAQVTPDGPAAKAGLKQGDVVLAVNGERIGEMRRLPRVIADIPPGETIRLTVWRNGREQTVRTTVGTYPESKEAAAMTSRRGGDRNDRVSTDKVLGLKLAPVSPQTRRNFGLGSDVGGVVVTDVGDDSPAADKGIQPGDIIVAVENEPVSSPADVVARIERAQKENRRAVLLLLNRESQERFVAIPLGKG